jgi:hypothetical protein
MGRGLTGRRAPRIKIFVCFFLSPVYISYFITTLSVSSTDCCTIYMPQPDQLKNCGKWFITSTFNRMNTLYVHSPSMAERERYFERFMFFMPTGTKMTVCGMLPRASQWIFFTYWHIRSLFYNFMHFHAYLYNPLHLSTLLDTFAIIGKFNNDLYGLVHFSSVYLE